MKSIPKKLSHLNLVLSLISLTSLLISSFFIYQNYLLTQKLKDIISTQQNQPTPTSTPSPAIDRQKLEALVDKIFSSVNLLPQTKSLGIISGKYYLDPKPGCIGIGYSRQAGQIPNSWVDSFIEEITSLGFSAINGNHFQEFVINIDGIVYLSQLQLTDKDYDDNAYTDVSLFTCISSDNNKLTIQSPQPNSIIRSPLIVRGVVPAGWMFEGVFPIKLLNSDRQLITQALAKETISGSWQSDLQINFTATLTFKAIGKNGYLVLTNDNPSGLPQNEKSYTLPIFFPSAMEL